MTQGVSEEPTAPVKGIVATKTLSATKTSAEIVKTPQSVSVITRDQMNMRTSPPFRRRCATRRACLPSTGLV
ncbi:hypothetical protein ACVXG7_09060 [Enterobacter hormaechei]